MTREQFIKKFKVGDIITQPNWDTDMYSRITHIGKYGFVGIEQSGDEFYYSFESKRNWLPCSNEISDQILEAPEGYASPATYVSSCETWQLSHGIYCSESDAQKGIGQNFIIWPTKILINGKEEPLWIKIQ